MPQQTALVRPLLNELDRGTAKERAKALTELKRLSAGEAARSEFVVMGHASRIVEILKSGDPDCRTLAAGIIANVSATDACTASIIAAGALPPLVQMLTITAFSEFQEEAASAMRSIAASEQGQKAVIAAGAVEPLIQLLSTGTAKGKINAGSTIGYLAAHLQKAEVTGFLPGLVAMISSNDEEVAWEGTHAICHVATTSTNRAVAMEAGVLPPLLHLLSNGSLRVRAEAAAALGNLAIEGNDFEPNGEPPPAFAGAITEAGAVPGLLTLLDSHLGEGPAGQGVDPALSNKAMTEATRTLSFLAIERKNIPVLVADGIIPALITMLQEGKSGATAKGWVAAILAQLAKDGEVKKEIFASVPLVTKTVGAQKRLTAQIMCYC